MKKDNDKLLEWAKANQREDLISRKYADLAYKALIELLVDLCSRYKLEPTQAIIRHYDVRGK